MVVRRAQFDLFVTESPVVAVMLTDCDCEIEHTVSALTQHVLCGKRSTQTELSSLGTAQPQAFYSDTPPYTPFHPFSSILFNNPGNLNRWKRVSGPAASTQIEVLSCMVIRPRPWKWQRSFLARARLPSSSCRQRVVGTPVESTAKIMVVLRKGRVSGWRG